MPFDGTKSIDNPAAFLRDLTDARQDLFDRAVRGVLEQGKPSTAQADAGCYYRNHAGLKCAVGHLIDDSDYDPSMERLVAGKLVERFPQLGFHGHTLLLSQLQGAHDGAAKLAHYTNGTPETFLRYFRDKAKRVAESFKLEWRFG
jgi:hypothetical protein